MEHIVEREKEYYQKIIELSADEKQALFDLIEDASNDGYTVRRKHEAEFDELIRKELIFVNRLYSGYGRSYQILPHAPYLMRKLNRDKSFQEKLLSFEPCTINDKN
jgi:hypothetical protein